MHKHLQFIRIIFLAFQRLIKDSIIKNPLIYSLTSNITLYFPLRQPSKSYKIAN